ncbi:NB-ARC [Dillenia turbinata]|uniref:NB-ARC n=1 Tax=Dillenia turbinata TaxID=194707 RepID=A0AAN8W5C7_9MAGN
MADTVVQSVVSNVLGRISDQLINEVKFLQGVADQVRSLEDELKWVQSFLRYADASYDRGDERLHTWVADFREIAYDAEDAIDTYIFRVAFINNRRGSFRGFLKRLTGIFKEIKYTYQVGLQIKSINGRIADIRNRLPTYGITTSMGGNGQPCSLADGRKHRPGRRHSYANEEEEDVVGLDEDINKLVQELTNIQSHSRIVSIVGIGGSGKTTLARKVYNHSHVKRHFDCSAWISISQEWRARDIFTNILTQISSLSKEERELIEKMTHDELVLKVQNRLKEKLYLLVLDDIWKNEAWDELKPSFPSGILGSKHLLTTRIKDVALHADPNCFLHMPRSLKNIEAWELLSKKVKRVIGEGTSQQVTVFCKLGKEMVKKCGGLPLAIVVLGGLLATRTTIQEWEKLSQNISSQLRKAGKGSHQHHGEVLTVLALSYNDLPYHLKSCFLYLGLFPEDFEIRARRLIRMWIAEGFILSSQIDREETLEDAGEDCLHELIQRSMIQVGTTDASGRVKTCRMHDLMRDLCLEKARDENFLQILSPSSFNDISNARRIALHFGSNADAARCFLFERKDFHLRSLLYFGPCLELSKSQLKYVCTNFPLIRVFELYRVGFPDGWFLPDAKLPKQIGHLVHLKYLGFRGCSIGELPKSLGALQSLQTLDIRESNFLTSGGSIVQKMEQLRYLHVDDLKNYSRDFRVNSLTNLRCLARVEEGDWIAKDLPHLTDLQKLGISAIKTEDQMKAVLESPCITSDHLHSLSLSHRLDAYPSLEVLSHCQKLSKLYLWGKIAEKTPLQQQLPPNITKLTLYGSELKVHDPMATLEMFPFLKFLKLSTASYMGTQMACSENGFPRLEHLQLIYLPALQEWKIEKGAMPRLNHLTIRYCQWLKMIPEGLSFVTTIQELRILDMPREFKDRLQNIESCGDEPTTAQLKGVDFYKIKHIPSVKFE